LARTNGSFRNLLVRLSWVDVVVIDDWAMAPLSEPERRDFREICEDRYQVRSLILTSQLPVTRWHEQIGDLCAAMLTTQPIISPRPPPLQWEELREYIWPNEDDVKLFTQLAPARIAQASPGGVWRRLVG
jgi:hypothetical protein